MMMKIFRLLILSTLIWAFLQVSLHAESPRSQWIRQHMAQTKYATKPYPMLSAEWQQKITIAARNLLKTVKSYDPSYLSLNYPGGDVPREQGVCTDMVIRSLRSVGLDLQKLVHEDMAKYNYPKIYNQDKPDRNIDHRRVPNLMKYFSHEHLNLPITEDINDYQAADIVAYDLGQGVTHIGVVSDRKNNSGRPLLIHHISQRPREEDVLFDWKIIGHYRLIFN